MFLFSLALVCQFFCCLLIPTTGLYQLCTTTGECDDRNIYCNDNECELDCQCSYCCSYTNFYCNNSNSIDGTGYCKINCINNNACSYSKFISYNRDFELVCTGGSKACLESSITVYGNNDIEYNITSNMIVYSYTDAVRSANYTCIGDNIEKCNLFLNYTGASSRAREFNFYCDSPYCKLWCPTDLSTCGDINTLWCNEGCANDKCSVVNWDNTEWTVVCPPTLSPTPLPTDKPTNNPSDIPSDMPTNKPTNRPTEYPTKPTQSPIDPPSNHPTNQPSAIPTVMPSELPTYTPTATTVAPTRAPTHETTNVQSTTTQMALSTTKAIIYYVSFEMTIENIPMNNISNSDINNAFIQSLINVIGNITLNSIISEIESSFHDLSSDIILSQDMTLEIKNYTTSVDIDNSDFSIILTFNKISNVISTLYEELSDVIESELNDDFDDISGSIKYSLLQYLTSKKYHSNTNSNDITIEISNVETTNSASSNNPNTSNNSGNNSNDNSTIIIIIIVSSIVVLGVVIVIFIFAQKRTKSTKKDVSAVNASLNDSNNNNNNHETHLQMMTSTSMDHNIDNDDQIDNNNNNRTTITTTAQQEQQQPGILRRVETNDDELLYVNPKTDDGSTPQSPSIAKPQNMNDTLDREAALAIAVSVGMEEQNNDTRSMNTPGNVVNDRRKTDILGKEGVAPENEHSRDDFEDMYDKEGDNKNATKGYETIGNDEN